MPGAVDPALRAALAGRFARVQPVVGRDGRKLWLKQVERPSARMRLQKGDPRRAFEAERGALHLLSGLGLPVVPVMAEAEGWFATLDCGETLNRALRATPAAESRARMMAAAGAALAALHGRGYAHGRPVLRDICWDGTVARFIDLERFSPRTGRRWAMALDLAMLVQSWFTDFPDPAQRAALDAGFAAWAAGVEGGIQWRARALGWLFLPLDPLARLIGWLRPRAREFRAFPLTLAYLRRSAR